MKTRILSPLFLLLFLVQIVAAERPNVVIVLTDDQGYGDLSLHGNPVVETPHTDALAMEGVRFEQFHVTSMCSPTRAALLTGLNPLRNGVISTCQGLHSLRREHPTMAEAFAEAGYATGLFGKWHLGRNWPRRPQDRGFQEALVLHGFGQTGISSRWNNDYVDTWVLHNGEERQLEGFCTDAFFNEAMRWMQKKAEAQQPFFAIIPTNAPHFPFWAPEEWTEPFADSKNPEFFAMVANLDDNMGRLDTFLQEQGLRENTIVIFLTDNGPVGGASTYNAGMTGTKASPWEAGHRVPLFVRYPAGGISGGHVVQGLADVTDLFPTLLDLCMVPAPRGADLEGISLKPFMTGKAESIPERLKIMHIQQHNLEPKNAAIMRGKWRLLWSDSLYDIEADLAQQTDVAPENASIFVDLWKAYQQYLYAHRAEAQNAPAEIVGSDHQDVVVLDASYWLGQRADGQVSVREAVGRDYGPEGGDWKVEAAETGRYRIELRRWPIESGLALSEGAPPFQTVYSGKPLPEGVALPITMASLDVDGAREVLAAESGAAYVAFETTLEAGEHLLRGVFLDKAGKPLCGAFYAYITKLP